MIFRRIGDALVRRDWATVIVELIIVIVGILIALQVDNWNKNRQEEIQAAIWRQQIIDDLHQSRFAMESRRDYYQQALHFGEDALNALETPADMNDSAAWRLVLGAYQAGQIWSFQLTGPTYREVQNAGGFPKLANKETLRALARLYDVAALDYVEITGGKPRYRDMIRERTPWPIQQHFWDSDCQIRHGSSPRIQYELTACNPPASMSLVRQAADELRADSELIMALRGRLAQLRVTVFATGNTIREIDSLIVMLEKEEQGRSANER